MELIKEGGGFKIVLNNRTLVKHDRDNPFIFIGKGEPDISMYRGNFKIKDYLLERIPLRDFEIKENTVIFSDNGEKKIAIKLNKENDKLFFEFESFDETINRTFLRVNANKEEKIYGCGEQMSYFNLRGRNFPLWTSEPGVGRDKSTLVTWKADTIDQAGGDYYNTNYPQPTFVSTEKYYCHVDSTAYMDFNFKNDNFHELEIWETPKSMMFETGESYIDLVQKISEYFGTQPELPEWVYNGVILGLQGGTDTVIEKMENAIDNGVKVAGLWCQDWEGKRITSFGKRLMWDWKWNPKEYPGLDEKIKELKKRNIRFLGYINPYVAVEGELFAIAEKGGYLALNKDGGTYLVDFGEFDCGVVDFTNPEAFEWFKDVIKKNMIDFGLDGWMADFGEYLPTDCYLKNGVSAEIMHNEWPAIWARCNYEAVKEAGKLGEVVYFMRAGFTGTSKYCTLLWAGDQSVDFSLHDGLASVIPAALSSGMMGNGLHHSDMGGYTSLHGNQRSKELFMRWADFCAFTPVMRGHESNRPDENHQFDDDQETLRHMARTTDIYTGLVPYIRTLVKENAETGLPVQRPIFMHYENDARSYDINYQYMLGSEMVVAPVHQEGKSEWEVYLPEDEWVHLWTGKEYSGGDVVVDAPIGKIPVFYRKNSEYKELFEKVGKL